MEHVSEWFAQDPARAAAPWAVVGKGPTFARRGELDLKGFKVAGLNHVCAHMVVDVTMITDVEVLLHLGGRLRHQSRALFVPFYLHAMNAPHKRGLDDRLKREPVLRDMEKSGKLFWYRSSLSEKLPHPDDRVKPRPPAVRVRYFSAVAAVNLLAAAGVRTIRTLGVDGGTRYAPDFAALKPLTNGRPSFDVQFGEIARAVADYKLDLAPFFPPAAEAA